jgi:two-component system, chemotaxis family, chemotaxis protein CheY
MERIGKLKRCGIAMRRRVLIVDDSLLMRRLVAKALTNDGWDVVGEASDGNQAVEKYKETQPDAMTLDITMPGCDGLHAIEAIMAVDPKARIVVVSALNQSKLISQAIRAGAQGFIAKPFQEESLREAMNTVMEEPAQA